MIELADGYEPMRGASPVQVFTEASTRARTRMSVNGVQIILESHPPIAAHDKT